MVALMLSLAAALPVPGRSIAASQHGVAASSQPLAAQAAVQILQRGGNAVDAAIAANSTQGLMEPTSNGIGGDLFAIVYVAKEDKLYGLNASGWSPAGMTLEFLKSKGVEGELPHRGVYTVTVPGAVAGWAALHQRFGRLPLATDLAPAIWYAENGFPVMEVTAGLWARSAQMLSEDPESAKTFLLEGRSPKAGETFRNPALANSLRRIVEKGSDGFYRGPTAQAIVEVVRARGGAMTLEDLAEFKAEWVDPIQTTYRGWKVTELPPNGQGIAALEMLNILEQLPIREWGFHSARTLHAMIEAKKLAYADLLKYIGDPRSARIPVEQLLSRENAVRRAQLIDPKKAACHVEPSQLPGITASRGSDTIYLTVVDGEGNIVSLIQSNYAGFGSGLTPKGAGFMLQNRGNLFTLKPGQPNTIAGRKRPLHTIIPAFMQKDDVRIGFGIMGGWNQSQAHAQFVVDIADFGMTIQQALEAGRFTKGTFEGCDVEVESSIPQQTRDELTALGHLLEIKPPRTPDFGYGQAVLYDRKTGVKLGASDPRHDGMAIPVPAPYFPRQP
jgi:gamma-glutamyltranspeptidase/glutathione hydrolase